MSDLFQRMLSKDPGLSTPQLEKIITEQFKDDDYINGRFIKAVQHFEAVRRQNYLQYGILQRVLIVASALTPLTVGLEAIVVNSNILKLIALILSVFVAILGNYLTTFNLQAKWRTYRIIRESLTTEFYRFYMGIGPYSSSDHRTNEQDRRLFATNIEKLIEDANKVWGELYSPGSKPG